MATITISLSNFEKVDKITLRWKEYKTYYNHIYWYNHNEDILLLEEYLEGCEYPSIEIIKWNKSLYFEAWEKTDDNIIIYPNLIDLLK